MKISNYFNPSEAIEQACEVYIVMLEDYCGIGSPSRGDAAFQLNYQCTADELLRFVYQLENEDFLKGRILRLRKIQQILKQRISGRDNPPSPDRSEGVSA